MSASIILPGDYVDIDESHIKTGPGFYKDARTKPFPFKAGIDTTKELKTTTFRFIDGNNNRVSFMLKALSLFIFGAFFFF